MKAEEYCRQPSTSRMDENVERLQELIH